MKKIICSLLLTVTVSVFGAENNPNVTQLQKSLEEKTNDHRTLSESYQTLTTDFATLKTNFDKRKNFDEIRVKQGLEKLETANKLIENLQSQIKNLTNDNNMLKEENNDLQKKLAEITLNITNQNSRIETEKTQHLKQIKSLQEEITNNKTRMALSEEMINSLEKDKKNLTQQKDALSNVTQQRLTELQEKQNVIDSLNTSLREANASANPNSTNLIQQLNLQVSAGKNQEKKLISEKEELTKKNAQCLQQLATLQSQLAQKGTVSSAALDNAKHMREIKIRDVLLGGAGVTILGLLFLIYKLNPHFAHA